MCKAELPSRPATVTLTFTYESRPGRVIFGVGRVDALPDEVDRLGVRRVLLVCTPRRGEAVERAAAGGIVLAAAM